MALCRVSAVYIEVVSTLGDLLSKATRKAAQEAATKVMHEFVKANAGSPVIFIYDDGATLPCHATVKVLDGPWSVHRVGFCGEDPTTGPVPWCKDPDGGLCHICAKYVEKVDGLWRVKAKPVLQPVYYRQAERHDAYISD